MNRLSPTALRLRRIHAVASTGGLGGVLLLIDVGIRLAGAEPPVPVAVVPVLVAALVGAVSWVVAGLAHRAWAWSLEPDHLRVDRGVVVRRSALIPRRRVQHVSTRVGPLQDRLDLATLVVHTAGARTPNVVIEHLDEPVADALRADLAAAAIPDHAG